MQRQIISWTMPEDPEERARVTAELSAPSGPRYDWILGIGLGIFTVVALKALFGKPERSQNPNPWPH